MSRNNDYTAGNLLYYLCHQSNHKRDGTELSREENMSISRLFNFTGKLEKDAGVTMIFIAGKQQKLF